MSDELTAELRGVYEKAHAGEFLIEELASVRHARALLAVARYSAERQRGMEATEEMKKAMADGVYHYGTISDTIRALQSAAPLWVDKK